MALRNNRMNNEKPLETTETTIFCWLVLLVKVLVGEADLEAFELCFCACLQLHNQWHHKQRPGNRVPDERGAGGHAGATSELWAVVKNSGTSLRNEQYDFALFR
jgi:hypothetical protein